jgi:hypothetical protein
MMLRRWAQRHIATGRTFQSPDVAPPGIREYSNQQLHLNSIERSQSYGVSNGAPGRTIPINVFDGRKLPMAGNIDRIDQVRLATRQGLFRAELEPDLDYYRDLRAHALVGSLASPIGVSVTDLCDVYVLGWTAGGRAGGLQSGVYDP